MYLKKIFLIYISLCFNLIFSKEINTIVHDEWMPPGHNPEIVFESNNEGLYSEVILYFTGNIFYSYREDIFGDSRNFHSQKKLTDIERYENFMTEKSLEDYFSDRYIPALYEKNDIEFLYGRANLGEEYLTLKLNFIDKKTDKLEVKIFRVGDRKKINEIRKIIEKINEEKYSKPKVILTKIQKENIAIITRKIKYFGSDAGISGNYKELYEKVIEIFKDKLPPYFHYIRKPEFELINE